MKFKAVVVMFLLSTNVMAWEKMIDCDNGSLIVDRGFGQNDKTVYQIVLRNQQILSYFIEKTLPISAINQKGELIVPVVKNFNSYFNNKPNMAGCAYSDQYGCTQMLIVEASKVDSESGSVFIRLVDSKDSRYGIFKELANWDFQSCRFY